MKNHVLLILLIFILEQYSYSQVLLDAKGENNTYELITSVLAPGGNPIETPDCSHPEFGDHIDEVLDPDLNEYIFRFHIHKTPDNDRCINFDRQRNEIKTYSASPNNLLGIVGETVEYKWKFKIDANFQSSSSFTHLHQLKAVGGPEEGMPLITFTARKGTPDKLELRYSEHLTQETLYEVDLDLLKGSWVQVDETVTYGENGSYSVSITKVDDETILFNYENNLIRMWKTDAEFIRPKWGIYRSLNNPDDLRDEIVLFANFSITEVNINSLQTLNENNTSLIVYPNPTKSKFQISNNKNDHIEKLTVFDLSGKVILQKEDLKLNELIDLSPFRNGMYIVSAQAGNALIRSKLIKN